MNQNNFHQDFREDIKILPYDMGVLISYLTRLNNENNYENDIFEINQGISEFFINFSFEDSVKFLHNSREYKEKIWKELQFIAVLLKNSFLHPDNREKCEKFLQKYMYEIFNTQNSSEILIWKSEIENIFQMPKMFEDAQENYEKEFEKYKINTHPEVKKFSFILTSEQIQDIMHLAIEKILNHPKIDINFLKNPHWHRLFWNINSSGVNYILPQTKFSDYMSFEFPHNATHLIHLSKLPKNVHSYNDNSAERSFFEWLAVLSEYTSLQKLENRDIIMDIYDIVKNQANFSVSELQDFLIADRIFEFRLRALRLLVDDMVMKGKNIEEIRIESNKFFQNAQEFSHPEIEKYFTQTGLWGIYTTGYLRLQELWFTSPIEVLEKYNDITTWNQLCQQK